MNSIASMVLASAMIPEQISDIRESLDAASKSDDAEEPALAFAGLLLFCMPPDVPASSPVMPAAATAPIKDEPAPAVTPPPVETAPQLRTAVDPALALPQPVFSPAAGSTDLPSTATQPPYETRSLPLPQRP